MEHKVYTTDTIFELLYEPLESLENWLTSKSLYEVVADFNDLARAGNMVGMSVDDVITMASELSDLNEDPIDINRFLT